MTVLTTFAANMSAADARDTLNQLLADVFALKAGGGTTPPAGSGVVYDKTAKDTGFQKAGERATLTSFVSSDQISIAISKEADGTPGNRIWSQTGGYLAMNGVDADGTESLRGDFNFQNTGGAFITDGQPMPIRIEFYADRFEVYVRGQTAAFKTIGMDLAGGAYIKFSDSVAVRTIITNVS